MKHLKWTCTICHRFLFALMLLMLQLQHLQHRSAAATRHRCVAVQGRPSSRSNQRHEGDAAALTPPGKSSHDQSRVWVLCPGQIQRKACKSHMRSSRVHRYTARVNCKARAGSKIVRHRACDYACCPAISDQD